jgi:hypothetical protein
MSQGSEEEKEKLAHRGRLHWACIAAEGNLRRRRADRLRTLAGWCGEGRLLQSF